jgi:FkbM family methyltransferase
MIGFPKSTKPMAAYMFSEVVGGVYEQCHDVDGKVVFDIGANLGYFSAFVADRARAVYAFEPEQENFKELIVNTMEFNNVHCFEQGLWSKSGVLDLAISATHCGAHSFLSSVGYTTQVAPVITLDEFCDDNDVIPEFIKLDVESAEAEVIKGGLLTIKKHKPVFAIEFHSFVLYEEVVDLLAPLGYYFTPPQKGIWVGYSWIP